LNNRIFNENSPRPLSGGRDSSQGPSLAEKNAVCDYLEIL
jgi:hypothetical protein